MPSKRMKDRMRVKCAKYRAKGTRELNKLRRLRRHIRLYPNDGTAISAVSSIKARKVAV